MDKLNLEKAIKRYNNLMFLLHHEEYTIGTEYSEHTDGFTIRDMVDKCESVLSEYYEAGHMNHDLKEENYKAWVSETGKLKRFIDAHKPFIEGVKCVSGHCSRYDN